MRLLAVFAHPDDELGCVGTLAAHAERGDEVLLVFTTQGELASQYVSQSESEVRRIRQEHGAHIAGLLGAKLHFFDMGDSRMTGSRAEALQLARLYCQFRPDAILTWSDDHPHPDHRMTAKIAFDAVTLARIPKIVSEDLPEALEPHRQPVRFYQYRSSAPHPVLHVDISRHIDLATECFAFYQAFYGWTYRPEDFRQFLAQTGQEAGVAFAEAFQLRDRYLSAHSHLPGG